MQNLVYVNDVELIGRVSGGFIFSHSFMGINYYKAELSVKRQSGADDLITIMVDECMVSDSYEDNYIHIFGSYRSYNPKPKGQLFLSVLVDFIELADPCTLNVIKLTGALCKSPVFRITPLNRKICDITIAVNRPSGKADYFPCIAWGKDAYNIARLEVGSYISLEGRIQSREYLKIFNQIEEIRMINEISITKLL